MRTPKGWEGAEKAARTGIYMFSAMLVYALYLAAKALTGDHSDEGRRNMLLASLVIGALSMAMVLVFDRLRRGVGGKVRSIHGLGLDDTVASIRGFMAARGLETREVPPVERSSIEPRPSRALDVGGGRLGLELHKVDEGITWIYVGPLPRGEDAGLADLLTGLDEELTKRARAKNGMK